MGAGFASGREIWQFFGIFGDRGIIGVIIVGFLFIVVGIITSLVARTINDSNMGRVIVPGGNEKLCKFIDYFMAFFLYTVLITMSAAAGALVNQQFGINRMIGGLIIVVLVIVTVIGGFDRISHVFRYIMPVLLVVVIVTCIMVVIKDLPKSGIDIEIKPSPLAKNWMFNPILYLAYNMLAVIPIVATAAVNAKNTKNAVFGSAIGGLFLGFLALVLALAMNTDPNFSHAMDMPMLAYSEKLGMVPNLIYAFVLMFAIYASATGNFYGFTTVLKENKKNIKIILLASLAFVFGLAGFKNIVAYVFPISGFLGLAIVAMILVNFVEKVILKKGD